MSIKNVFLMETTGNIIRMLGLPEDVAKKFTEMYPKADFALPKSWVFWVKETYSYAINANKNEFKEILANPSRVSNLIAAWKREMGEELVTILKTKPALEKKINSAKSHTDIMDVINSGAPGDDAQTLFDLGEGWKWVKLEDRHHSKEARTMQHCATDSRGELVSLRDPSGNPHVTMTYNKEQNIVYQIKGKQNVSPKKDYWDAIKGFFEATKADIKDPFIKRSAHELFNDIKKIAGKEVEPSHDEAFKKLFVAISDAIAKQWAWDFQPFTFDNPDVDYENIEDLEDKMRVVFERAGYSSAEIEPSSGMTRVFFHPSAFKQMSDDPAVRAQEVPPYKVVQGTWQGITLYELAKEAGVVNPAVARNLEKFGMSNAATLNVVYNIAAELFSAQGGYDAQTAVGQNIDNYISGVDYDDMVGLDGAADIGEEAYARERNDKAWEQWMMKSSTDARKKYGSNFYDHPEYRELWKTQTDRRNANLPPPEE